MPVVIRRRARRAVVTVVDARATVLRSSTPSDFGVGVRIGDEVGPAGTPGVGHIVARDLELPRQPGAEVDARRPGASPTGARPEHVPAGHPGRPRRRKHRRNGGGLDADVHVEPRGRHRRPRLRQGRSCTADADGGDPRSGAPCGALGARRDRRVVVLQMTFFPDLRILGVCPISLLVRHRGRLREGAPSRRGRGFAAGLRYRPFLATPLGLSALACALVGYAIGSFQSGMLRHAAAGSSPVLGGLGGLIGGLLVVIAAWRRWSGSDRPARCGRGDRCGLRRRARRW